MKFPAALLLSGMLVIPALHAEIKALSGYVTRVSSSSDFDVNGIRIRCDAKTSSGFMTNGKLRGMLGCPTKAPYLGEPARVEGSVVKSDHSVKAESIGFAPNLPGRVSGSAVIDRRPRSPSSIKTAGDLLVRADGYRILITGRAFVVWDPPMNSFKDVKAGDWIYYLGRQQDDGTVVAEKARFTPIVVRRSEEKFRQKSEFDPSKVSPSARQNILHEAFLGVNYKKIPPATDAVLQARIEAIGDKLIPKFERSMPDGDPAKIDFRFQLTADPTQREVAALPSGIILVPRKAAERMQNDSQLAALLAGGIASALERGPYRMRGAVRTTAVAAYAYDPIYGPGATAVARALARHKQAEQSGRVALGLMQDAGYDVEQAPVAWWLLASKRPKPLSEVPLPRHAAYLYKILGECWNNPAAVAARQ